MMSEPWFPAWNHRFFEVLFELIPRTPRTNSFFEFLIANPLVSTWFYAWTFLRYWMKSDALTIQRRTTLMKAVLALAVAVVLTLLPRPWIGWPAPNSSPLYAQMFPSHLRGTGSENCFPSHSTLVYFTIALGFWPIDRRWSSAAMLGVLFCISLPRVYLGGHYSVDVVFSCLLGVAVFAVVSCWKISQRISDLLVADTKIQAWNWLFFLWIFELGEGFRGSELIFGAIYRWCLRL